MSQFTAVVTTGIYCRAGCPARPLRRNTLPYALAAAAEADGFRPCLRCRPDRVPDHAWLDAPELVCRALHLISAGTLDGTTEDTLAARLGVSARHLRRLFADHVGATPAELARSQRAHFARRLLDDTDLPMGELSRAAGFTSVRQMNRVMLATFRYTPSELRCRRRDPARTLVDGGLVLRLPYRPPIAWRELLRFMGARATPGVEVVDLERGAWRRTVEVAGHTGVLEALLHDGDDPHVELRAHLPSFAELVHVVRRVRHQFDLDGEPARIDAHLRRDPRLRRSVRACPGLRVPGAYDPFEVAVRAVLGQQVSVASATRLAGRVAAAYGPPAPGLGDLGLTHRFPAPAALTELDGAAVGLPGARAAAVRALAAAVGADPALLDGDRDLDASVRALTRIPGIGPWTAQYVAMRCGRHADALPASDLGLRRVLGAAAAPAVTAAAEGWRPFRAVGAMHCWSGRVEPAARVFPGGGVRPA